MAKLIHRATQFSLQTKVFLTFLALLLFVLGCFIVYVNLVVIRPLTQKTEEDTLITATKVREQVDLYVEQQNQMSQRILSNKDIFTTMDKSSSAPSNYERLNQIRKLKDIMFQAIGPSMNIKDMSIYDKQGVLLTSYLGSGHPPTILSTLTEKSRSGREWTGNGFILLREADTISFLRTVNDQNGKLYGYLSIQMDQAYIQNLTEGITAGDVFILNKQGEQMTGSEARKNALTWKEPLSDEGLAVDEQNNYVTHSTSHQTGWITFIITPKDSVLGSIRSVQSMSILLITALMLISFVYIFFSTRNLLLPIRKLRSQIWRINYSNMKLKVDDRPKNNDLLLLNEAFQDLMERLQQSIDREKKALHEEVTARNSALQAQIAPHFLHNVLYLISIAAQEGRTRVVSDMCKHLSDSLRYIVSSPYAHVTMTEELEHTRHYLSLVQQKYEEDLEWSIHADDLTSEIRLPRLVIQPFVENCIEHAFFNTTPPWRIQITVKQYNGLWALEIKDNGEGFPPNKIEEILSNIQKSGSGMNQSSDRQTALGNMGIVNSVNRLKLMYSNRLLFNMYNSHSDEEKGATIQIIGSMTSDFY
ncbi:MULTISPECIES: cache domain-containing sensor histidine kinase [Paenibacillus]|uniref:Two-component system sensor histidine kinase YesM n=1 Tax=Paenibacillus pabuli TaxID=1472 RepID=A0A855Y510_9BACL|nr:MULTISPECIES: sensor histidine kinase [Paenibacillus]PWW36094.1 two-component system sensor histidine kinase YesM [Paenibacillus pabuli]PXW03173.1 two-component system sensor histidine kinase YesM [Paenibacillus taichungensis]QLG40083.1 histidine kinase [Paenibacillus sp. E222]